MFAPESDALRTAIEDVFSERRPGGKPERRSAIFVFESQEAALTFALSKSRARLYRVLVRDSDILHRADWEWLVEAHKLPDEPARWADFADSYWAGKMSPVPVIELMVREARVETEITISHQQRLEYRERRYGLQIPPPAGQAPLTTGRPFNDGTDTE